MAHGAWYLVHSSACCLIPLPPPTLYQRLALVLTHFNTTHLFRLLPSPRSPDGASWFPTAPARLRTTPLPTLLSVSALVRSRPVPLAGKEANTNYSLLWSGFHDTLNSLIDIFFLYMYTLCRVFHFNSSERLAKYNQLLRIEEELNGDSIFAGENFRTAHLL